MNERILLRFFHEDLPVEITSVHPDHGIVLGGETSDFPIAGGLAVFPASDTISQNAFKRIAMIEDWRDGKFRVRVDRLGDRLVLTGGGTRQPQKNLPAIGYTVDVRLKDVKLQRERFQFRLAEAGTQELDIRILEPKKVKFADLKKYDDQTRRIVTDPQSILDGAAVPDWLQRPAVRGARKVCLLNLLAQLRALPDPRESLSAEVASVLLASIDRIVVGVGGDFLARMRELTRGGDPAFGEDSGPIHPTHFHTRDRVVGDGASQYKLHSFRQRVSQTSMQIIVGEPPAGAVNPLHYAEIDIDLGNPGIDLAGFGVHMFELITPSATDHFRLASKVPLDFRYYSFVKTSNA